jgi:hypothetical protein
MNFHRPTVLPPIPTLLGGTGTGQRQLPSPFALPMLLRAYRVQAIVPAFGPAPTSSRKH